MHTKFIALYLASLSLVFSSTTLAWRCIGNDCLHSANQIAFSVAESSLNNIGDPAPGKGWQWSSCGEGEEALEMERIVVSPDPPVPGRNLTVSANGVVKYEVGDGTFADVVVKLGLIRLLARRFDVCEQARLNDAQLKCPLSEGAFQFEHTVALPREIPPGRFNVHITGENQDGVSLVCLDLSVQFGFRR